MSPDSHSRSAARRRVLLVAPRGEARLSARTSLRDAGFQVDEAPDAESAMRRLAERRSRYSVVVVDLADADPAERLVTFARGSPTPPAVVVCSDRENGRDEPGVARIKRPCAVGDLLTAVAKATAVS
jgi:PleD family two-component response regulator